MPFKKYAWRHGGRPIIFPKLPLLGHVAGRVVAYCSCQQSWPARQTFRSSYAVIRWAKNGICERRPLTDEDGAKAWRVAGSTRDDRYEQKLSRSRFSDELSPISSRELEMWLAALDDFRNWLVCVAWGPPSPCGLRRDISP
jgi:hypothetical protein